MRAWRAGGWPMRAAVVPLAGAVFALAVIGRTPTTPSVRVATDAQIEANDNTRAAGTLRDGVLTISLVAGEGTWYPEAESGPGRAVYTFGESATGLRNPGPMIRVPAGTEIVAIVHNAIDGAALTIHGLHDRPAPAQPIVIAPDDSALVRFRVTTPGTYYYWGSTRGAKRTIDRFGKETQLNGAFIVDPPGARVRDHVFVIGIEGDSADIPPNRKLIAAVVNGRTWPHGPQMTVHTGDTVRMRWINPTDRLHPMHLHGFYFDVESRGDIAGDTIYDAPWRRKAVTELMMQGSTMAISWVPERPGNWLMHCHMAEHMSPHLRGAARHASAHAANHSLDAMSGIVTGWRVVDRDGDAASDFDSSVSRRAIRLLVQTGAPREGASPTIGFVIDDGNGEQPDTVTIPGPPLVLTRGEPVQITVVNRLDEPTSIHWHGIELDSYFDGVSGWSGIENRISPQVAPRDSFQVRFTPPRSGTFIYHSHFDEERQLASGLFGPIVVLDSGQRYDPATDLTWVIGQLGPAREYRVVLNGSRAPELNLERGKTYRVRLVNISPNIPLIASVLGDSIPVMWRAVAKDGADLPEHQATSRPAVQMIGVGEVYDFELTPPARDSLRVILRGPFGPIRLSGIIRLH